MRKYSQVFLKNENISIKIANHIKSEFKGDVLIEIGPGMGALSKHLIDITENLYFIEIDPEMIKILRSKFSKDLNIINQDFLKVDLDSIFKDYSSCFFAGNLPYHISTAIIEKLMYFEKFAGAIFMFQKEVADKIIAKPGQSSYGYFSALCSIKFKTQKLFEVSKYDFYPVPKVDSAVVLFEPINNISKMEFEKYRKTISASFAYKRKNILNSLSISLKKDKQELKNLLEKLNINPMERAENISPDEFMKVSKILC